MYFSSISLHHLVDSPKLNQQFLVFEMQSDASISAIVTLSSRLRQNLINNSEFMTLKTMCTIPTRELCKIKKRTYKTQLLSYRERTYKRRT